MVGHDAISSGAVARAKASARVAKTMPERVPVLLLGRLAVDQGEQGRGLGAYLLQDAVLRTLQVADQVGVRALLSHAANEQAAAFYARFEFEPSPTDPLHMLLLLKDARVQLGRSGQELTLGCVAAGAQTLAGSRRGVVSGPAGGGG